MNTMPELEECTHPSVDEDGVCELCEEALDVAPPPADPVPWVTIGRKSDAPFLQGFAEMPGGWELYAMACHGAPRASWALYGPRQHGMIPLADGLVDGGLPEAQAAVEARYRAEVPNVPEPEPDPAVLGLCHPCDLCGAPVGQPCADSCEGRL